MRLKGLESAMPASDTAALERAVLSLRQTAEQLRAMPQRLEALQKLVAFKSESGAGRSPLKALASIPDPICPEWLAVPEQVAVLGEALEAVTKRWLEASRGTPSMLSQARQAVAISVAAQEEEMKAQQEEARRKHMEKRADAAGQALAEERSLRMILERTQWNLHALEQKHNRLLKLDEGSTTNDRIARLQSEVEGLDRAAMELRRHLALYDGMFSEDVAQLVEKRQSEALAQVENGTSALMGLPHWQEQGPSNNAALSCDESSAILGVLMKAQQSIAHLEKSEEVSDRRWLALSDEVRMLRNQSPHQQAMVQRLKQKHADAVRGVECRVAALRQGVSQAVDIGPGQGGGAVAADLLLQQLDEVEMAKQSLEDQLNRAANTAANSKQRCEADEARLDTVTALYGDAEEAADCVEEVRHGGAVQRAATLEAINRELRKQVELAKERKRLANEQLQRIHNLSDPHDLR